MGSGASSKSKYVELPKPPTWKLPGGLPDEASGSSDSKKDADIEKGKSETKDVNGVSPEKKAGPAVCAENTGGTPLRRDDEKPVDSSRSSNMAKGEEGIKAITEVLNLDLIAKSCDKGIEIDEHPFVRQTTGSESSRSSRSDGFAENDDRPVHTVLGELLSNAHLSEFEGAAFRQCKDDCILDLADLYEKEISFSAALKLKPLERKRLRKALGRSGGSVTLDGLAAPDPSRFAVEPAALPVPGLKEIVVKAELAKLCGLVDFWCEATGAVLLQEVRENALHLMNYLGLLADSRDRLSQELGISTPVAPEQRRRRKKKKKTKDATKFMSNMSVLSVLSKRSVASAKSFLSNKSITSATSADCLIDVFKMLDEEGTGRVSPETLQSWFATLGMPLNDADSSSLMEIADVDDNGLLDYVKFVRDMTAAQQ